MARNWSIDSERSAKTVSNSVATAPNGVFPVARAACADWSDVCSTAVSRPTWRPWRVWDDMSFSSLRYLGRRGIGLVCEDGTLRRQGAI